MRTILRYAWRVALAAVLLTGITFVSYNLLARLQEAAPGALDARFRLGLTFLASLVVSLVLTYVTARSRWTGTQLMCAVFVAYFGLYTFIPQSEAMLVVAGRVALSSSALLTAQGFLGALLYSFALVALMGRLREEGVELESGRLHMGAGEWLWKVGLCIVLGPAADLTARAVAVPLGEAPSLPPLPHTISLLIGRSLLLIAFMLPIIKMLRGGRLEASLTVGVLLSILAGLAPLAMARLFLPQMFSVGHLVGISVANLLYGLLVGYLFSRDARRR